jgi:hypothetical protein
MSECLLVGPATMRKELVFVDQGVAIDVHPKPPSEQTNYASSEFVRVVAAHMK